MLETETVVGVFRKAEDAWAAIGEMNKAKLGPHIRFIENESIDAIEVSTECGSQPPKQNFQNFYSEICEPRLVKPGETEEEILSYFQERYSAKDHFLIVHDCQDAHLARKILEEHGAEIDKRASDFLAALPMM